MAKEFEWQRRIETKEAFFKEIRDIYDPDERAWIRGLVVAAVCGHNEVLARDWYGSTRKMTRDLRQRPTYEEVVDFIVDWTPYSKQDVQDGLSTPS